jgi:hypothetical protein
MGLDLTLPNSDRADIISESEAFLFSYIKHYGLECPILGHIRMHYYNDPEIDAAQVHNLVSELKLILNDFHKRKINGEMTPRSLWSAIGLRKEPDEYARDAFSKPDFERFIVRLLGFVRYAAELNSTIECVSD